MDTGFLIGVYSKKDENHDLAIEIREDLKNEINTLQLFYSDYIFDELITYLKKKTMGQRLNHSDIIDIGEKIHTSKVFQVLHVSKKTYEKTWELIKEYQDKRWSFTDASSFVLMNTFDIQYFLSFDVHFSQYPNIMPWGEKLLVYLDDKKS